MIKSAWAFFGEYTSDIYPNKTWTWCWIELEGGDAISIETDGSLFRHNGSVTTFYASMFARLRDDPNWERIA